MPNQKENKSITEILRKLKKLPEEDRILLGLYLYEGLSSDEISKILENTRIEVNKLEYAS